MTQLIEEYLTKDNIKAIAIEKNYDDKAYNLLIQTLDRVIQEDIKYGFDDKENYEVNVLNYVCEYMDEVEKERQRGFSFQWSKEFAYIKLREQNLNPASMTYSALHKENRPEALENLKLYSDLTGRDDFFIAHFKHLIETDLPNATPSPEEQAVIYSAIFKEQIRKGKSEVFASEYASLKAMKEYSEVGCYAEAAEYEKALNAGYSKNYAKTFAMHLSEYIANYCCSYEESIDDELVLLKAKELEKKYERLK